MTGRLEEGRRTPRNGWGKTKEAVLSVFQTLGDNEKISVRQISRTLDVPKSKVRGPVSRLKAEGNILVISHLVDIQTAKSEAQKGNTAKRGKLDSAETLIIKRSRLGPLSAEGIRKVELDVRARQLPKILKIPSYEEFCREKGRKPFANSGRQIAKRQLVDQVYAAVLSLLWVPGKIDQVKYEDIVRVNTDLYGQLQFEKLMNLINGEVEFLNTELSSIKNFFPFDVPAPRCRLTNQFIRKVINSQGLSDSDRIAAGTAWISYITGEETGVAATILKRREGEVMADLETYTSYIDKSEDLIETLIKEEVKKDPDLKQVDKEGSYFLRSIGMNSFYHS